jgi:CysZ protein
MDIKESAKRVASTAVAIPKTTVVGFWRGLTYPFKGMRFVFLQHPELIRFWGPPILIVLTLIALVLFAGWELEDDVVSWMWAPPSGEGWMGWLLSALHGLLRALVTLVLWVLGLVAVVFASNVIAAPFNDLLSEEVERLVTGREGPRFSLAVLARDVVRTVLLELAKLSLYFAVMAPTFLLSFIPVIGPVLYAVVGFLFTTLYFAVDYIDWPASRRNRGIRYRFGILREHFLPMFGFGTGVWLFLFIPLVNLLFMPAAVAGGTLLFLDVEAKRAARAALEGQ